MKSQSEYTAAKGEFRLKQAFGRTLGSVVFFEKQITDQSKNVDFHKGVALSCVSNKSPRAPASSFADEMQSVFLWLLHGDDVEMPIIRVIICEYMGINTDICAKR